MHFVLFIVIGLIAGALAGRVVSGHGYGALGDIVVGIVGAFLGGLIFSRGDINEAPLDLTSFLVSLVGAVILLAIVNLFRRGRVR
jgi:uncharacterized membrane protein YeaQ/YmgE (transglycosylase-associated protein family)